MAETAKVEIVEVGAGAEAAMRANSGVLPDGVPEDDPGLVPDFSGPKRGRVWKRERVLESIRTRLAPFGRVRLAYAPVTVLVLVLKPNMKPLRGEKVNDWRLELLVAPNERPTPKWRRYMNDHFGMKLCGLYRTTPNPKNPLPVSVEGWWWHGGSWLSAQLAAGVTIGNHFGADRGEGSLPLDVARITPTEARRWSVWLEAKTEGRDVAAELLEAH